MAYTKDAIADYEIVVQLACNNAKAYLGRGISKAKLGLHEDAITDFDTAIRFKRDNALAYGYRGLAKAELHQGLIVEKEHVSFGEKQYIPSDIEDVFAVSAVQPEINNQAANVKQDLFTEAEQDMLTALKLANRQILADLKNEIESTVRLLK